MSSVGPTERARQLREDDRLLWQVEPGLLGMPSVVEADGEDLRRPRYGRVERRRRRAWARRRGRRARRPSRASRPAPSGRRKASAARLLDVDEPAVDDEVCSDRKRSRSSCARPYHPLRDSQASGAGRSRRQPPASCRSFGPRSSTEAMRRISARSRTRRSSGSSRRQIEIGLDVVSDGEFRRWMFVNSFYDAARRASRRAARSSSGTTGARSWG